MFQSDKKIDYDKSTIKGTYGGVLGTSSFEASITDLKGGDSGHGARASLEIHLPDGEFDMQLINNRLTIRASGDDELTSISYILKSIGDLFVERVL